MNRLTIASSSLLLVFLVAAPVGRAQEMAPWEVAGKTWESAMSQYRQRLYNQAATLFEEFTRRFPRHEQAAHAHLMLASCKSQLKDPNGWEKALDQVIQKFPGGGAWFVAYRSRLSRAKAEKTNDEYVALLEAMLRACRELPLDLTGAFISTTAGERQT